MKVMTTAITLTLTVFLAACNGNPAETKSSGAPKSQAGQNIAAANKAADAVEASQDEEKATLDAMAEEEGSEEDEDFGE